MSDEVERTCPLCAEEMDLTDQQLKPCKCGYEICVWCWHHIMDMAEKDDTDGRCPACRTAYDKEKIVGMAANCGRMMAEINSERRLKSQKAKSKASDGRKHLSSVRVIQRHLVYIIGLPNNLADEAILERKEYFGQYGKVLKVSITRPAGGSQHPSNTNTCSVYITYTKEEDAIRCIQSVHGFVLEGRSLRACFGTTKYCHTWLRNMPCNNPDCLYLHDMGTPEDSFTKDEIISAYTRSRVQQITGAANNSQRRSGNVLPPPADEFSNNIGSPPGKTLVKNASNVKVSPNGSSSVRSSVLPAAASWGQRVSSSCQQPAASMPCLQGPAKQKTDTLNSLSAFSSTTASEAVPSDLHNNGRKILMITKESDPMDLIGRSGMEATKYIGCQTADAHTKVFLDADYATMTDYTYTPPEDKDRGITMPPNFTHYENLDRQHSFGSGSTEVACGSIAVDEIIQSVSSRLSSIDIDNHLAIEGPDVSKHPSPISDKISTLLDGNPVGVRQHYPDYGNDIIEPLTSLPLRKAVMVSESSCVSIEKPNWYSELQTQVLSTASREMDDVLLHVDEQRLKLSEAATYPSCLPYSSNSLKAPHLYSGHLSQHFDTGNPSILDNADPGTVNIEVDTLRPFGGSVLSNGHDKNKFSSYGSGNRVGCSDMISNTEKVRCLERFNGDASEVDRIAGIDIGESSIISNILSLDYDSLDDSLNSPRGLAKLFGETDKQNGSLKLSSSWKPQNSNQSRFSFARQEDFVNQATHLEPTLRNSGYVQKKKFDLQDSVENKDTSQDKLRDGFTCNGVEISESLINGLVPSNKVAVSRSQKSAPPGFSVPSRLPPPGFSSQESADRSFVSVSSGNQLLGSPLLRKQYQAPSTVNMGDSFGDVEFIDPAILAVGKGAPPLVTSNSGLDLASTYPAQLNFSEYDSRLRLLMQQSFSTHQNFRVSEHMTDHFSPLNDSYISSSLVEPTQGNSPSHLAHMSFPQSRNLQMSNGQWDGRNGVQASNDVALSEIVRNELLGFTNYFPGHEESKFHIPSSGNLYNRAFGM